MNDGELPGIAQEIGSQAIGVALDDMSIVDWCIDSVSGDFLMLFVAVFAIVFVCSDYSSGYIKNIYGCIKNKLLYGISKIVVIVVFVFLSMLVAYVTTMIANLIIIKSDSWGEFWELIKYTGVKILLLTAYGTVCCMIATITRKATVALVIVMGYSFLFANMMYTGINQLVTKGIHAHEFAIEKYALIANTISVNLSSTPEQINMSIIVSLVAIVFSISLGTFFFKKGDV